MLAAAAWCSLGSAVPVAAQDAAARRHDPRAGIDHDGRIERPDPPADLPNPARWRYVPEGRIVPGNPLQRLWVSSFIAPTVFAEPDIGVGGGLVLTDIDFRNQRRQEFAGLFLSYTTEGQQSYRATWRRFTDHVDHEGGGVFQHERAFWQLSGGYQRTLTRRFYGFGADTREGDETSYTDEVTALRLSRQLSLFEPAGDWIARVGVGGEFHNLSRGRVSDVPTTRQAFPLEFADGDSRALLRVTGAIERNTRDSLHSPLRGTTLRAFVNGAPLQDDGSSGAVFGAEGSAVLPIPSPFHDGARGDEENPPTDTFAVGAFTSTTAGDLPFYSLPSLGGPRTLRGYINNRWTDRSAWHASAEWRFWFWPRGFPITERVRIERVGAALFYDVGSVADDWDDLSSSSVHDSYGVGLRFHLERLALFRIDVGFSDEDTNVTINYGLPF